MQKQRTWTCLFLLRHRRCYQKEKALVQGHCRGTERLPGPFGRKARSPQDPGIGAGFFPDILQREPIDEVVQVSNDDVGATARRAAKEEGLLVGISSGPALWAVLETVKWPENQGKLIVAVLLDTGERYLSTWLFQEYMQ